MQGYIIRLQDDIGGMLVRIAITTNGKNISEQFGKTIKFTIFEVLSGQTKGKLLIDVSASGDQDALIYVLKNEGVEVLLCGEITQRVKAEWERYGIEVIAGLKGNIHALLKAYVRGRIKEEQA